MIVSLDGAIASAPIESDGRLSVFGVHVPLTASYSQMPPCAAPRMNWPLLGRIARAPIRPLIAANPPPSGARVTWAIGFGPRPVQGAWNVAGPAAAAPLPRRSAAACAAVARNAPACWLVSALSPAVRREM